jgi:hypothetical protein
MKTECQGKHKLLKRGTKKKELLYVLCLNPEGCNQKTFYPQKIDTTKEERQV